MNVLNAIGKEKWTKVNGELGWIVKNENNERVVLKAKETLNVLKN